MITIRPATSADFMALRGRQPPLRCRAWAGEVDGRLVALWGVAFGIAPQAQATAFLEGADEARKYPVTMHKAALAMLAALRESGLATIAMAVDIYKPRSEAWARRLGFEPIGDSGVWLWRTSESAKS